MKTAFSSRHVEARRSPLARPVAFAVSFALAVTTVFGGLAPSASAGVIGNSTISLVATPTSSTFGQSVTLTATVSPVAPATGTPTGTITFKVDGVQVTSSPLSGGVASTFTTSLAGGTHTITAVYSGNAFFNGSSKSTNYTVGCGTTITGAHGQVIAAAGTTTCLSGATISGPIVVPTGAAIDIENSTISGSFSASNAPGAIRICGSTFGGSVTIINAQALVTVGDPGEGCASNTITGTLLLQNNTNGVRAIGNKVGGLVNSGNSGPGPYPGVPTLITSHAPPVAADDSYLVLENQTLNIAAPGVLANDSAPSGGTLTAALVAAPNHGNVTLNSDGSFSYVPASGFFGTDSFTYQDSDGIALSNVATVTISVHAPPVAVNDSYTVVQGTTLTVPAPGVLGNDSAPSGGTLTAAVVAGPTSGSLTLNADGSFTYTPNPSFHGTDSFTYRASDGVTTSNVATVTITVNTPPSVTVTKSEPSPGAGVTVTAGQSAPITYQFSVANSGQTPSGTFTLSDPVPAGSAYVAGSASCPAGLTATSTPSCSITTGSTITWTFSNIPALTTYSGFGFQVTVKAADRNGSTVANTASFTNVNTPNCATNTCTTNSISNPIITPTAVSVTKSETSPGADATVVAGQATPITYRFSVTNAGGTATTAFTLTDPIPAGSTLVPGSAICPVGLGAASTPTCTVTTGAAVTWTFSSIPASTTYNGFGFQVSVNANDGNATTIANAATFTNFNTIGCSTATCTTNTVSNPVVTPPAVTVTKGESSPGSGVTVTSGQAAPITYGFSAVNSGGSATGPFTITDTVPTGTTYVAGSATCPAGLTTSSTPSCTIGINGATITWTFSSVPALTTYSGFGFQVAVSADDANATSITNGATYTNINTPSCALAPTCATNVITNPVVTPASISVVKTEPSPGNGVTVTAGQAAPITYQLAVVNSGGTATGAVTVSDAVPPGTTYLGGSATCPNAACSVSFAAGTVTWTFTSVAALSTNNLTFQVSVNANDANDANGSTISNQASFTNVNTSGCTTGTCTTNSVTNPVLTPPSVTMTKSEPTPGAGATVIAGQATPISYQFSVANAGGEASGAFTVSDSVPAGTTYVAGSATCPAGLTTSSTPSCTITTTGTTVTWTFSAIPALTTYGGFGFQVSVNANDANNTSIANAATFTNVNTTGCSTATCTTNTISNPVVTPAAVTVTKSESSPGSGVTVTAGQAASITYGFSAVNSGGSATGPFTITDVVPVGTTYVAGSATCPAGLTTSSTPSCTIGINASTITWTFSSVPALTTYSGFGFQVAVSADDANATSITNNATYTNVNGPSCGNGPTCTTNTISNPVVTPASVIVTKSETSPGDGVTVIAGQTAPITYQLAVVNSGGTASGPVTITDSLSPLTTYVAGSASCPSAACTVNFSAGTVTWTFSSVTALSTSNLTFQATVNADAGNGLTIANSANFTNVNTPGCSTATCGTNTVANTVSTIPVVSVSKSEPTPGAGAAVAPGQATPISYRFQVNNFGGTPTGPVTMSDAVPAGTTLVANSAMCPDGVSTSTTPSCMVTTSGSTVIWTFSAIPAFTTYSSFGFQVLVNANAANGDTISNSATFTDVNTAGCAGAPTCTTNTITNPVVTPASVTVTKAEPTPGAGAVVRSGQSTPLTYQFAVANSGGTDSGAVTVSDTVPAGTTLVPSSATCPAGLTAATTPSCAITTGATVTWTFSSIPKLTVYSGFGFQVSVNSNLSDGTTISNSATFTNTNTPGCTGPTCTTNSVTNLVDTPPTVTSTVPTDTATHVALNATITVNFSKAVTVTATAFKLECPTGTPVAFTVSPASPASTFLLTPSAALPAGVVCTVTAVASQIADAAGTNMAANFSFSFTVDTPPTVTGNTPANGATGVLATVHPTITFSAPVTATGTAFKLECPTGTPVTFTVSPSGPGAAATFTLTPLAALPGGTVCTVTAVASQIADAAGTNLAANFSFSFTVDTPPAVTSTTPANGATGVLATVHPTITFSAPVTATGTAFKLECPTGTPVTFTVSPASPASTFVLTPSAALPAGVVCTVTAVASQITDAVGTTMAANFSFSFTVDTPPTVTTTTPTNGATSVLATVHPSVTFNKAVTATNTAFKLECPTGTSVTFTVSPSGPGAATTFTLTPSADLPAGVVCTVTAVASQIADSAGTNMAADFSFSFTVDTPPTVIGNTPANNATDVPLATTITVTFSKAVSVTAGGFTLECPSGTAETFTVSPALPGPGTTFTLTPSSALPSFTNCAVTVVASHVTDAPGTAMVANFGFTFQTAAVPTVVPQSFSGAIGNTTLGVGAAPSQPSTSTTGNVLTGDTNGGAGTLAAVTSGNPITTANGGSVTMNSDGTFVYQPPAGFVGNDTFTYVVTNGLHTASSTVTITVANRVWYVNSASGTNGNGTSTSPFNVLSSAQSASAAGDFIFLYGSATNYSGGITLKATQTLLGQSVGLVVSGHTLVTASGSNPTITNSGGAGITLGEGDTVNGITVSGTSGAGITASSVNGATIGSSVTVTGSTGDGIDITGGNGTFSVGTTITTSSAHSVNVQSRSGGTTTFSGPITDPGTGLLLNSNSGATINFTGTISATTGTHQAFTATAGGTVSATGSGSTLTTTSADALVVSSTTIGSGNLNFKSISSNGATDGISLTSTGTSGGLTVTGNGSPATGGTIQNSTGAGVYADSAANINLSWMNIANNGSANNSGIGFDNGGDGVKLDNISGTGHLTSSTVTGSNVNNVEIHNNSATLSAFTIQGPSCSITNNNTTNGDVGIQVLAENTGVITATVDSCNLSGNRSDAIQGNAASGTASLTMTVTNNTIVAGTGGANQGNIGIDVVGAAATTLGYTISGNKVGTPDGTTDAHLINDGINVFTAGTSSSAVGTITNNIVFGPGAGVSGIPIRVITGTTSTGRSRVQGNTVHGLGFDPGILVQVGQNAGSTAHGDMGVFNNTVDNPPATTGDVGINVETADAGVGCFSVTGNVKGQTGGSFQDLNVVAAGTSTFDVAGATLGSITAATVQSYEAAHNFQTGPAGVVVAAKATTASFVGVASTACNIP